MSWGSLKDAWWGSPDGDDQVAVGVLRDSESFLAIRIAVWDGMTGQLRSLATRMQNSWPRSPSARWAASPCW